MVKKPLGNNEFEWKAEEVETVIPQGLITIVQFAAWKGCHRNTIGMNYSDGEFKDTFETIKSICEAYSEKRLYEADRAATNLIFAMKNSYGWIDKSETELSGGFNAPLSDESKAYLAKATRADTK